MIRHISVALLLVASVPAFAAVEGLGKEQSLRTARRQGRIHVDGKLDEADWVNAPVFDGFLQRYPVAGAPPSERTEMRVLYDDHTLYVALTCFDSEPAKIDRRLARRDADLFSDAVQVIIDPTHDHRTAYLFYLSAGGVQGDGLLYDDRNYTSDWDAVWDGASEVNGKGWTAEYAIPLSQLRFPKAPVQTWGFGARRDIARKNEELDSTGNPRSSNATPSRLGHLTGLEGLEPRRSASVTPYVAARTVLRPQYEATARPRLLEPSAYVGLDFNTALTSDLNLTGTINPDFGQVEADQVQQNLSTFELFFPEKRPFFTQGMELFQPVGGNGGPSPQTLFYSRRIGLTEPILGAAKLTGNITKGVEVGVLDAVIMGPQQGEIVEDSPRLRFGYSPLRPLHFGRVSEWPDRANAPTNYFAGVLRAQVAQNSNVGGVVASAVPLTGTCTLEESRLDDFRPDGTPLRPSGCDTRGGNAAALTFDLKTSDSAWGAVGQLTGSQTVGGPPERMLRDGTVLKRGELGSGAFVSIGKFGGEGLRLRVDDDFALPTLELNSTGFMRTQNEHHLRGAIGYARETGLKTFRDFWASLGGGTRFSTDGRNVPRGSWINFNTNVTLPSFDNVGIEAGVDFGENTIREVSRYTETGELFTGIPLERPPSAFFVVFGNTNPNRPFQFRGYGALGYHFLPAADAEKVGYGLEGNLRWRPHNALETNLQVRADLTRHGPRFVDDLDDDANWDTDDFRYHFADLDSEFLSVTLRQQWLITPKMSLQLYAQLFSDFGVYGRFYEGVTDATRAPIRLAALAPYNVADPAAYNFSSNQLAVNLVYRWEYRLGSTLYLVYTRSQGVSFEGADVQRTLAPVGLTTSPATDTFMVKWSYYWAS